jgi:hypothetical protein
LEKVGKYELQGVSSEYWLTSPNGLIYASFSLVE